MNRMSEVAAIFGVQLGETFNVTLRANGAKVLCKFEEDGFYTKTRYWSSPGYVLNNAWLKFLLTGEAVL